MKKRILGRSLLIRSNFNELDGAEGGVREKQKQRKRKDKRKRDLKIKGFKRKTEIGRRRTLRERKRFEEEIH